MKYIGLVAVLALASLSCQRKEAKLAERNSASAAKPPTAASAPDGASSDDEAEGRATKSAERPPKPERKMRVAEPVADKPGFVKSPFSGTVIDVRGIPAGTLVADPLYPASEMKHFRVPELSEVEELKQNAPAAREVPGKQGFIFSPYDNKIIDASGIEPGTVIQDPSAPAGETRYIKVPDENEPDIDAADP